MKIDTTKIILIAAVIYIGWVSFLKPTPDPIVDTVTIVVPEKEGTTGIVNIEPEIIRDTVFVKGETIEVDKGYKELYEKAKDSLEKKELYLEAIKINKYNDTIVNNDDIVIRGSATTRGTLLDYSVDYILKEKSITYTPEVVTQLPKLSGGIGLEIGVPTIPNTSFVVKANLSLMNRKGKEINISYDTDKRVWLGYKKTFKIFK